MYGTGGMDPASYAPDPSSSSYPYRQRTDHMNRSFHQYGGGGGGERGGSVERGGRDMDPPPQGQQRIRSRTPGPDFMRRRDVDGDMMMDSHRVGMIPRSKTPTHDDRGLASSAQYHASTLSGTPDFIPASQYNNGTDLMYRSAPGGQYSGAGGGGGGQFQDPYYTNPPPRLNASQSFGSALNSHQAPRTNYQYSPQISPQIMDPNYPGHKQMDNIYPGNRLNDHPGNRLNPPPRKQSTSFEHVEPAPSNLTRIPPHRGSGVGAGGTGPGGGTAAYEDEWLEMTVFLTRQESGFGFRIIGGTEEGSQVSMSSDRLVQILFQGNSLNHLSVGQV